MNKKERLEQKLAEKLGLYFENGLWNSDRNINLSEMNLTKLPLKFGKIMGNFWCFNNKLTSLKGAPYSIGENFDCSRNRLKNLENTPTLLGSYFDCSRNQLTSLLGCPAVINGNFWCDRNQLTNLVGAPTKVDGVFDCSKNKITLTRHTGLICNKFIN
jgi:hypothetical protein